MLRKAEFRIDFKAWQYGGKMIKMSENLTLPYRTEKLTCTVHLLYIVRQ